MLPGLCSPSHQTPLTYARIVFVRLLSTRTTITESSIPSTATKVRVANLEEAYNKVKPAQGECICHKCKMCASAPSVTKSEGQATPLHPFGNRTPATIRPSTRPPLLDPLPAGNPGCAFVVADSSLPFIADPEVGFISAQQAANPPSSFLMRVAGADPKALAPVAAAVGKGNIALEKAVSGRRTEGPFPGAKPSKALLQSYSVPPPGRVPGGTYRP